MHVKTRHLPAGFAALLSLGLAAAAPAQESEIQELKRQMEALRQGQEAIQKDLGEIRKLLTQQQQRQPARRNNVVPPNTVLSLEGRPTKGAQDARLAIIEFLDYQ